MRTMASVWFLMVVLISVQKVFGDVCLKDETELTCNECMRCNGDWCTARGSKHCYLTTATEDGTCPSALEKPHIEKEVTKPGVAIKPVYAERTLLINKPTKIDITYNASAKMAPELKMVYSTQTYNVELMEYATECSGDTCTSTIQAKAATNFCNVTGGISEYIEVTFDVGLSEKARIKYNVPCACPCSGEVETASVYCSKNGDFSCGACTCNSGWTGEFCEINICSKRGDVVQCSLNPRKPDECSGNGYCSECETCICYTDREGSQYFDQENNCEDLCMSITNGDCEDCLVTDTLGECNKCSEITIEKLNRSLTDERDFKNRKVWVSCKADLDDCGPIEYYARQDESKQKYVMMVKHCNEIISEALVPSETKVPIILGVLGIVAAVAAVGGVMLWKHLNAVPPVPLNDPQYQNIDAEDCTGENPLYKPPTSSFKNPTYGKW
ncbi:integrin beta-6-like [Helicoverpa zea]|uniref:integrin beta-6-like n=1 Tax=Helicoverpa zea TaxID=7113 RepID=UPI001F55CE6E|nr:integrin beta-6-like [Helicoverpa zea]